MFYMPHKPIVKQSAVTTKVRMVFDASAKPQPLTYSINDCMFTGPPLQPLLWDIMIRVRMSTSLLLGDIEKAFLQIGVKEEDRDAVRFLFNIKGTFNVYLSELKQALSFWEPLCSITLNNKGQNLKKQ